MLRIITDAMFIAGNAYNSNVAIQNFYFTIAFVFQDFMSVANTFMWLSLMYFWYKVTMPPKVHLKAFQVSASAFFVVFVVAMIENSVRQGIAQSQNNIGLESCTQLNMYFILILHSVVMTLFTGFVRWRVSLRLKHMRDGGEASGLSARAIEVMFAYCCAVFAVRAAGFYVNGFSPPSFCRISGFWQMAMQFWIPLTTSFLFLAVMWTSGVSDLHLRDPTLFEITDEGCDIDVGMEDVPTVGNNPLSHQRSSDSQLVELTLRA